MENEIKNNSIEIRAEMMGKSRLRVGNRNILQGIAPELFGSVLQQLQIHHIVDDDRIRASDASLPAQRRADPGIEPAGKGFGGLFDQ